MNLEDKVKALAKRIDTIDTLLQIQSLTISALPQ